MPREYRRTDQRAGPGRLFSAQLQRLRLDVAPKKREIGALDSITGNEEIGVEIEKIELIFPERGALRSRKVISRSNARPTIKYQSWKMGRTIYCESDHERNAFRLLDANCEVREYHEQPVRIEFSVGGRLRKHFPDVMVVFAHSREFWEIKSKEETLDRDVVERTRLLATALPRLGYGYRLVLGSDLSRNPRLGNMRTILELGYDPVSSVDRERIRHATRGGRAILWGDAVAVGPGQQGKRILARLFLEGVLHFDIEAELTNRTPFSWKPMSMAKGH